MIKVLPADNLTGGDKLVAGAGATPATPPRKGNLKKVETAGGKVKFSKGTKPAAEAAGKAATSVSVTCFVCDQVGHKSYQCPDRVVPAAKSSVNAAVAGNTGTAVPASQPVNATVASIQCKRCDARDHVAEQLNARILIVLFVIRLGMLKRTVRRLIKLRTHHVLTILNPLMLPLQVMLHRKATWAMTMLTSLKSVILRQIAMASARR